MRMIAIGSLGKSAGCAKSFNSQAVIANGSRYPDMDEWARGYGWKDAQHMADGIVERGGAPFIRPS
jgi:hypothetical protein